MDVTTQIFQSINAVSQKVNEIGRQLDNFTIQKHQENADKITEDESGTVELADLISEQNDALCELAEIVSNLAEKESEV
jgi:protein subunit release factor A